jgi:PmbA protein
MPLLIENRAAGRLLNHFLAPLSAAALQQQRSCFADKLGQSIASSVLTLVDDPFIIQGFGSRHFDGEGLSAKLLPIIDKGVLRSYFVDTYYGRKLGMDPTTASPSNLCFADGKGDLESLCQGIDRGVLVTGFIGGNSSSTTGDFSLGVRGFLIEKGKRSRAITEMNITDNLQTFLPKLVAVGADAYPYSSLRTPSLRFDDVQFSGS